MTAPKRIWANAQEWPRGTGRIEVYAAAKPDPDAPSAEYVRADLHDATKEQLAKTVEALKHIRDCTQPQCGHLTALANSVLAEIEKGVM